MAKILVKVPEPKTEYDFSNQKQISRAISAIVEQLNSTFLQQQKEDQERFTWYLSSVSYTHLKLPKTPYV